MNDTQQNVPAPGTSERSALESLWMHIEDFFEHLLHYSHESKHDAIRSMWQQTHHVVGSIAPEGSTTKSVKPEPQPEAAAEGESSDKGAEENTAPAVNTAAGDKAE